MPTVQVPAQLTVDHLMMAIKQLSPAELHEFMQQLAAWQQHNGQQVEEEAVLLARIEENSRLPAAAQRRYGQLRRKCERRTLTEHELTDIRPYSNNSKHVTSNVSKRSSLWRSGVVQPYGVSWQNSACTAKPMPGEYIPAALGRQVVAEHESCILSLFCPLHHLALHCGHFRPRDASGEAIPENLAWAWPWCNACKWTKTHAPDSQTGRLVPLFHPRRQRCHGTSPGVRIS